MVATVDSGPQMQAIEEEITSRVNEELGIAPIHRDGRFKATWRILDFGGCVVHLFTETARTFYDLERLWEHAKPLDWSPPKRARARAKKK